MEMLHMTRSNSSWEFKMKSLPRAVRFEYCISLIAITLRRESDVVILKPGQSIVVAGLPYCLITFLLGWWGIPWGVFLTPMIIGRNLAGGRDV
jgi:hypothetical protein